MSRNDDLGYIMLHEAIRLGESLGLVNSKGPRISSEHLSKDMDTSYRRTAWGLFNVDTYVDPPSLASSLSLTRHNDRIVHTGFLRPCLIDHVNIPRVDGSSSEDKSLWRPYPTHREQCPSLWSVYFDEACNLSTIARDVSRSMFAEDRSADVVQSVQRQSRDDLYDRLRRWQELLPETLELAEKLPPHIILLK